MRNANDKSLERIIDANFNRAKEGLRVCEDVCRFSLNEAKLTQGYKSVRHGLTRAVSALGIMDAIRSRDILADVGRRSTASELKRKNIGDIFYANSQRAKESLRVLEEFAKLRKTELAEDLKKLRYKVYALEKNVIEGR
ncbi:MAG TPA: thiamine-phosphate pyrophosphorylase [Candidatus Omnitrophota bacterium]|nr:thiamine-phosphate pyrophosphorylase [Candidatus Omnitrophota bacterium]